MKRLVRWVVVGFALFLFILLLIKIRVIVEVRVGVENSGLHIEVILLRRLLRREFTLENLKTGFDRGEAAVGWKQTEEAAQGRTLSKGWRRMVSPDIRLGIQQALMLRRERKKPLAGPNNEVSVQCKSCQLEDCGGTGGCYVHCFGGGCLMEFQGMDAGFGVLPDEAS